MYPSLPLCTIPKLPPRLLPKKLEPTRAALIRLREKIWVNGTMLHYCFFKHESHGTWLEAPDGRMHWRSWVGNEAQHEVVRKAFQTWENLGIGVRFREVPDVEEAEIRIGFMRDDGSWSFIGRDNIDYARDPNERTMNFGWNLTTSWGFDTALHEIGHVLGLPHEHQNPNAGIVWNDAEVYRRFAAAPNHWDRQTIYWNILKKHEAVSTDGSPWDPNSIMHYPFEAGLVEEPAAYRNGIRPEPGLSTLDKQWVQHFYPEIPSSNEEELAPFNAVRLRLEPGEQRDFVIQPERSRDHTIQTFGNSDVVMVLFAVAGDELKFVAGDDDSGLDRNALLRLFLDSSQRYILRVRLYHAERFGDTAVMVW